MKSREGANHHPVAVVNRDESGRILFVKTAADSTVTLDANGTKDPDGDEWKIKWAIYPEAGTYHGDVRLRGDTETIATVAIPADARGKTIHVILTVMDEGEPSLVAYRRAVIEVGK